MFKQTAYNKILTERKSMAVKKFISKLFVQHSTGDKRRKGREKFN